MKNSSLIYLFYAKQKRFLEDGGFGCSGFRLVVRQTLAGESLPYNINKLGLGGKMKMKFFPYELKLRHVFTVATYSRTTTPDVQVEIEYEGITGYGKLPCRLTWEKRWSPL